MNTSGVNPETENESMRPQKPYDLTKLDPGELECLLHKRPDLRREIFAEANRREGRMDENSIRID